MVKVFVSNVAFGGFAYPRFAEEYLSDCTTSVDEFLASNAKLKIAVIEPAYTATMHRDTSALFNELRSADLIMCKLIEGRAETIDLLERFDWPNVVFAVSFVPEVMPTHATVIQDQYWLKSTTLGHLNEFKQFKSDRDLSMFTPKRKYFDVLYGMRKPWREYVKQYIGQSGKSDFFLESEFLTVNSTYPGAVGDCNGIFWEEEINTSVQNKAGMILYRGKFMYPSQVLPLKVYKETAYSIVCETHVDKRFSFFTEKVAKPMIAGRLFVAISGKHYLRNLRSLGFKTFGNIIDESYDEIDVHQDRWRCAMDSALALCSMDQDEVMRQCAPALVHNKEQLIRMAVTTNPMDRYVEEFVLTRLGGRA